MALAAGEGAAGDGAEDATTASLALARDRGEGSCGATSVSGGIGDPETRLRVRSSSPYALASSRPPAAEA